jgi:hypothetical protein
MGGLKAMRAIITRPNTDGSYDEVGMNNRMLTGEYKTRWGLLKYSLPKWWKGKIRVEIYRGSIHKPNPNEITFVWR